MNDSSSTGAFGAQARQLAPLASQTTAENPWPLRHLAGKMREYIDKMPILWVEAQIVEYKVRPGTKMAFFVIRDTEADVSINVTAFAGIIDAAGSGFQPGAKVIMQVKPNFWETRGSLSLRAGKIMIQGEGDLLAQIEQLRRVLAKEGLFNAEHKKPLPFLPRKIGLICGRGAKAKEDVIVNASARWPNLQFELREVAVQGVNCVPEVSRALQELDAIPDVDVIVITRGGGSVEDLLPFSDESLVRIAAGASTPLVSAIGHEEDAPLLDLVADYRASTPTDAARKIVPDWNEQKELLLRDLLRLRNAVNARIQREAQMIDLLASRPVLAKPTGTIDQQLEQIATARLRLDSAIRKIMQKHIEALAKAEATLRAISPQATLQRGYAIMRLPSGEVIARADALKKGELFEGILADGRFVGQVKGISPKDNEADENE